MSKVIILVGPSGSGKSTWAREYLKNNPNTLRINRDLIRQTLVGDISDYYEREDLFITEKIVSEIEGGLFYTLLSYNRDILVDNTNLQQKYINRFITYAEKQNASVFFHLFDCELEKAKVRVSKRDFKHTSDIDYIEKQFEQYTEIKKYLLENFKDRIL